MKIALFSDIHGNSWALETVISDIKSKVNEKIIVCGHSHCARIVETGNKIIINPLLNVQRQMLARTGQNGLEQELLRNTVKILYRLKITRVICYLEPSLKSVGVNNLINI